MEEQVKAQLESVVIRWLGKNAIEHISPITPDASLRRYYRLQLTEEPRQVVAMVFDSVAAAEVGGSGPVVTADQAYVELTRFLSQHGIPVPELFFDARDQAVLLIEDLGEFQLCNSVSGSQAVAFSEETVDEFYMQAVGWISALQKIPPEPNFFPYQRTFSKELFAREIDEFREFVFLPKRPNSTQVAVLENCFRALLDELGGLSVALAHRDYHSWNLLIDSKRRVRVIDFQDACLAPQMYDLIALLHDRDTDRLIGEARRERLYLYFCKLQGLDPQVMRNDYLLTLLQRDLKVAGRFRKLAKVRGLTSYETWVPGTMSRIVTGTSELGRALSNGAAFSSFQQMVSEMFPDELA